MTATIAAAVSALTIAPAPSAATTDERVDVAVEWWDVFVNTIMTPEGPVGFEHFRALAITWFAPARAMHRDPFAGRVRDYREAAFAASLHEALVTFVPARRAQVDQALATTLSRIPDGPMESLGVAAGRSAARSVFAEREGDGLDNASVGQPYPTPPPAPGVWQPTPPNFEPALWAGLRNGRPFAMSRPSQFRPGPPPALGSDRYRTDWREVRDYGAANSTVRTAEQTNIAAFVYTASFGVFHPTVRVSLQKLSGSLKRQAELAAVFHIGIVDALIAVWDAKFHYLSWRPITAIRQADTDGDPTTSPDPTWTSLHVTPPHPDYLSGHAGFSGAMVEALNAYAGSGPDTPITLSNPHTPGFTRTYRYWSQLNQDVINARVWSGIHTRTSDVVGVNVGTQVTRNIIRKADELFG